MKPFGDFENLLSRWGTSIALVLLLLTTSSLQAQEESTETQDVSLEQIPIGEREPFDRLFFNAANKDAILDVVPLELPDGKLPTNPDPNEYVYFRPISRPEYLYRTPWSSLVKIELYRDMLLADAQKLVGEKKYDQAFTSIDRLYRDYPSTKGLKELHVKYLYENAIVLLERQNGLEALAVLESLAEISPDYRPSASDPSVTDMMRGVLDGIVGQFVANAQYGKATNYMRQIDARYAARFKDVNDKWQAEIQKVAVGLLDEARNYLDSGNGRMAHKAIRRTFGILRDVPGGKELATDILKKYPLIFVSVPTLSQNPDPLSFTDLSERRIGRIARPTFLQYRGQGQDGGVYLFPYGSLKLADDRRALEFKFNGQQPSFEYPPSSAFEVSQRLFLPATPGSSEFSTGWSRLLETVEIKDNQTVIAKLRFPHVLPEAFLGQLYLEGPDTANLGARSVYTASIISEQRDEAILKVNPEFAASRPGNWPEVIEQKFATHSDALLALEREDIDIIENVYPADVSRLRSNPNIVLQRYKVPALHYLVPNFNRKLAASASFRRALLYGINRPSILKQTLLGNTQLEGCEVISGPFPVGMDDNDPLSYANDFRLEPLAYDASLANILLRFSMKMIKDAEAAANPQPTESTPVDTTAPPAAAPNPAQAAAEKAKPLAEIVIAHPNSEVAKTACDAIVNQLRRIGVAVKLRELPQGVIRPQDDDWDFVYSEVIMSEPLVDVKKLLGEDGLLQYDDPSIDIALRRLEASESWGQARRRLYELHTLVYHDIQVLPLWQLSIHHARRKALQGVGENLFGLYDNIDRWQIELNEEK